MKTRIFLTALLTFACMTFASGAWADAPKSTSDVGSIVALKGDAVIKRAAKSADAHLKDTVQLSDVIETKARSRAKVLFVDESILTIAPESKASIKEFVYNKEGGGASIFNLIDGKMRAVVGKSRFEVHTATTVAAARGTVIDFHTGHEHGKAFTRVSCLEGIVEIWSTDPAITGVVKLFPGQTILMHEGSPLPAPGPIASSSEGEKGGHAAAAGHEGGYEGNAPGLDVLGFPDLGSQGPLFGGPEVGGFKPPIAQEPHTPLAPGSAGTIVPVTIKIKF